MGAKQHIDPLLEWQQVKAIVELLKAARTMFVEYLLACDFDPQYIDKQVTVSILNGVIASLEERVKNLQERRAVNNGRN